MKEDFVFTSESVTEGHPDKLCDLIADTVLDRYLQEDPKAKLSAECAVATGIIFIAARFSAQVNIDIPELARQVVAQVGYDDPEFNQKTATIMTKLTAIPSREEEAVATVKDQVMAFGFACNQTAAMMPLPIWLAHKLSRRLSSVRLQKIVPYLLPDGKAQVAIAYHRHKPVAIHSIVIVAALRKGDGLPSVEQIQADITKHVIEPVFFDEPLRPDAQTKFFVNPEGPFFTGGPVVHSGLTGRKNAVDTYGEYARHASQALSGKDPSRIDRIAAYAARHAAKNVIAAGLADECEITLCYTIGDFHPASIQVETFNTGRIPDSDLVRVIREVFDFSPGAIVDRFDLRHQPRRFKGGFYRKLAVYGHVGRMDIGLPWEAVDAVDALMAKI
jgi:S-adenosylmethionine synthetase